MLVHSDLEALAKCLTAFEGSAMPIVRIPGGVGDSSPAEHVQPYLSAARRALLRLAYLRGLWPTHVRLLLAAYVRAGDEARVQRGWLADLYLALLSRRERAPYLSASGADAAALRAAAAKVLEQAERAYEEAGHLPSDGRFLSLELDVISRAVRDLEARRAELTPRPKAKKIAPAPIVCAPAPASLECPTLAPCAHRGVGGLVNARPCLARAKGRRRGVSCRRPRVDRWIVRGASLVVSERSGLREPSNTARASKTWGLLLKASQSG